MFYTKFSIIHRGFYSVKKNQKRSINDKIIIELKKINLKSLILKNFNDDHELDTLNFEAKLTGRYSKIYKISTNYSMIDLVTPNILIINSKSIMSLPTMA